MSYFKSFEDVWRQREITFSRPPAGPPPCIYAARYQEWIDELLGQLHQRQARETINVSKLLVTDKLFEWRAVVPPAHRGQPRNHRCLWHCFEDAYLRLQAAQLALTPPPFAAPPPPAPRPRAIEPGIYLGEVTEGGDG